MTFLERLKNGTRPSGILKEQKAAHPDIRPDDLSDWLCGQIEDFPSRAAQAVIHWKHALRSGEGIDDDHLDEIIMHDLRAEGHLRPDEGPHIPGPNYNFSEEEGIQLAKAALAKAVVEPEPEPSFVMVARASNGPPGFEWIFSFKRREPDKIGKVANVFVHHDTKQVRARGLLNDAKESDRE